VSDEAVDYRHTGALNDTSNDGKPWRLSDDEFICAYRQVGFDLIGPHDLGRSPAATRARWVLLRSSGAAKAISAMWAASDRYAAALAKYHECLSGAPTKEPAA